MPYMKDKEISKYKNGAVMEQKGLNFEKEVLEEEEVKEFFSEDSEEFKDFLFVRNKHKQTDHWSDLGAGLVGDLEENMGNRVYMRRIISKLQE